MTDERHTISDSSPTQRWIISATVEAVSPLMLRTGLEETDDLKNEMAEEIEPPPPTKEAKDRSEKAQAPEVYAIDRDHKQRPFIPATALKALVRNLATRSGQAQVRSSVERIFGAPPEAGRPGTAPDKKTAIGGRAEFRNAYEVTDQSVPVPPSIRGMTRIDRATGAALDGSLRHHRVADPGSQFSLRILADDLLEEDIRLLVKSLHLLDGTDASAVGGSTGKGFGRIKLLKDTLKIEHLGSKEIQSWLKQEADNNAPEAFAVVRHDLVEENRREAGEIPWKNCLRLPLEIQIEGFFLVSYAVDTSNERNNQRAQRAPLPLRQRRASDEPRQRAWLPGSSLKGALRAQAERIWRTLHNDLTIWTNDIPPSPIAELFGTPKRKGLLSVSDFLGPATLRPVQHDMVAIDRFTGGAADGRKFSVEAFEAPLLQGEIVLSIERRHAAWQSDSFNPYTLSHEAVMLLAHVLRDLAEGDIPLGYGTRKGYGAASFDRSRLHLILNTLKNLHECLVINSTTAV
jgi:CRISPR/Cas system CSM-associated protein Csm3 (group 7 of RAMP superfamily)